MELHNYDYSEDIAHSANSTHDLAHTFQKIAGNRTAGKIVRTIWENNIGYQGTNTYSQKDSLLDVFTLGDKLFTDGLAKWQKSGNETGALSNDI